MGTEAKAPVASRWIHKKEPKGRVFFVLERLPFGKLELMQEGRAVFAGTSVKELLSDWTRLEGKAELPHSYRAS